MKWTPEARRFLCDQLKQCWGPQDLASWAANAVHPPNIEYKKDALPEFEKIRQAGIDAGIWRDDPPASNRAIENQISWLTTQQNKDSIERANGAAVMNAMAHAAFEAGLITASNCIIVIERAAGVAATAASERNIDKGLIEDGVDSKLVSKEGRRYLRKAYQAERDPGLRRALLKKRKREGRYCCEVCDVPFTGALAGHEVVHHTTPISCGERDTSQRPRSTLSQSSPHRSPRPWRHTNTHH